MVLQFALIISVLLQFGAFIITIKLIPKTRFNVSWIMISAGFLLMAIRRCIELIQLIYTPPISNDFTISNWIAVLISVLMFAGAFYINRIFQLQDKIDKIRKENESKILGAIIRTEEKERQIFSKELHDGLGPILSNIKMTLSAMSSKLDEEKNLILLQKSDHATNEAIIAIKEISNKLSPHNLERYGLEKAIKNFIAGIHFPVNFEINLNLDLSNKRFDFNIELVIYRIIGELVTNTIKHACATQLQINLLYFHNGLQILYSDNGKGLPVQKEKLGGMGLSNIESRVKSIGGTIEKSKSSYKGFFTKIEIPIHSHNQTK